MLQHSSAVRLAVFEFEARAEQAAAVCHGISAAVAKVGQGVWLAGSYPRKKNNKTYLTAMPQAFLLDDAPGSVVGTTVASQLDVSCRQ